MSFDKKFDSENASLIEVLDFEEVSNSFGVLSDRASSSKEPGVAEFALLDGVLRSDPLVTPQTRHILHRVFYSHPLFSILILLKVRLSEMSVPEQ